MAKVIPIEKNKEYVLNISSMGYEGEGVGKIEDFTIFVPNALLGEKVKAKIVKVNKNFAFGKLVDIIEQSSERVEPVCSIYKRCGGCQLQHYSYKEQLKFKRERVKACMERIGKLKVVGIDSNEKDNAVVVHDTIGMDNPYRYRNKVQLPVGKNGKDVTIGFYAARSHEIIHMDTCNIQDEIADEVVKLIKAWSEKYAIEPYNEEAHQGIIRHVMIRKAFKTGETMVVLVTKNLNIPHVDKLVRTITENIAGIKSIIQNINDKRTNVILGQQCKTLWGEDTISDYIGDFKFNISALSFFQVNPIQTETLYSKALEYADLTGNETVFDAYCGTGTISLFLSQRAKKVYGVEIIPEAIENAIENAKQNNVNNVEFIVGQSEKVIPKLIEKGVKADVVVVDPPRKGCESILLEAIAKMGPERVVYVSCDPGTLARDLKIMDELGYKTLEIQPVDMFPQTAHVECVAKLVKENQGV
ncbi:23S rRNA (uracil(1939)-C(5))-methyltransferase RlmD [Clostridiaceae bacterium UIB06]|uniref:23S rRNA (Uracil(1939)-C(5))-methyltransferase RlmD n=1 Tax=Clostridium thailandense TaxID=2794346 RepID=A0A949TUG7_9CLOT|nr:23S rRNA (uracil(1939)-C(5))-methyltransferase RlmD [Clostridium thailandense]MBV7271615.1 23S rRNA (uracil(1939)-C(5))-methyltransferase RlmD [Clostridium thailandense]MCH5136415.1 23S rRNA (uracil(1939)-C(5))-methyltransferase RlmD [Clostridiaceae bacterium UIB06]